MFQIEGVSDELSMEGKELIKSSKEGPPMIQQKIFSNQPCLIKQVSTENKKRT